MFDTAEHPDQLSVGLCWQYAEGDSLAEFADDPRVRRIQIPCEQSRGVCWARSLTQGLYRDETFTLQLDSHHRFAPSWDTTLIGMYRSLKEGGVDKPLISAYLPHYDPKQLPALWGESAIHLLFGGYTHNGPWAVKPEYLPLERAPKTAPARFVSGHFLFTQGGFCREVSYDPNLYFFGEEQSLTLRAFTHGYDIYQPLNVFCWHYYGRNDMPKHWSDNRLWWQANDESFRQYNRLIQGAVDRQQSKYGLGDVRTLADFARYSGIDVQRRRVSQAALRGEIPEILGQDQSVISAPVLQALRVPVQIQDPLFAVKGGTFVYVGSHDAADCELYRFDVLAEALEVALRDGYVDIVFESAESAVGFTVWPYCEPAGWLSAQKFYLPSLLA